jgi:hypothetical protein
MDIQGENARGPELPHAASLPGGALPAGSTLPRFLTFPGSLARHPFVEGDERIVYCRAWYDPWQMPPGWEAYVDTLHPKKQRPVFWGPRSVGALGKSVPGKLALVGLAAAHGQITERNYSVTRIAIGSSRYRYPDAGSVSC